MNAKLEPSCYYHYYNRGNNKENLFKEEKNYYYFLGLVKKYLSPIALVYSYCLLPNHFHLVLKIKDKNDLPKKFQTKLLSQAFSNLFNAYAKAINKGYNRTGSLFQTKPKKIKIEDETYLRNLIVYVNTNSSHHKIADFEEYKHSSYQTLISKLPTLLKRESVIELFDNNENFIYCCKIKKIDIMNKEEFLFE
ncbi:MAG: transposase [Chitinophagales bacterium]